MPESINGAVDQPLVPPRHIAIIMDGNGRWATKRGLPRTAGHKAGAETFRRIATNCKNIGVKYLTVYAFSTENWKRSEVEVSAIMALLKRYLLEAVDTMEKDHIRLHFFGDMTPIGPGDGRDHGAPVQGRFPGQCVPELRRARRDSASSPAFCHRLRRRKEAAGGVG